MRVKQYIKSLFPTQATGEHFNEPGHSLSDMSITILEKVKVNNTNYRKERERFLIKNFNTFLNDSVMVVDMIPVYLTNFI